VVGIEPYCLDIAARRMVCKMDRFIGVMFEGALVLNVK
jgi:hypothetical protein